MQTNTKPAEQIREATARLERAKEAVPAAEKIVASAGAEVERRRSALSQYEGLEDRIARAHLDVLKGADTSALDRLRVEQRERVLANEDLQASERALELARDEVSNAKRAITAIERERDTIVTRIVANQVEEFAEMIADLGRRQRMLRDHLRGLQLLEMAFYVLRPEQVPPLIQAALAKEGIASQASAEWAEVQALLSIALSERPAPAVTTDPMKTRSQWMAWVSTLAENPDAAPPPLPGASI